MLTLYSARSSFLKKTTVIVIWLIALFFSIYLMKFLVDDELSWGIKILPAIIGLFMIAGILLRCKIARGFTILTLYIVALFPLIFNLFIGMFIPELNHSPLLLYTFLEDNIFSDIEIFITNFIWALLFIIPLYFLSNDESMELFYIESNPLEHFYYLIVAIILSVAYTYYASSDFIELL